MTNMERYTFEGYGRAASVCGVQRCGDNILLTELNDNLGTSITNACTILATELSERYNIHPEKLRIIERYPGNFAEYTLANLQHEKNWFDHCQVEFRCPSYFPLTAEQAQEYVPH